MVQDGEMDIWGLETPMVEGKERGGDKAGGGGGIRQEGYLNQGEGKD